MKKSKKSTIIISIAAIVISFAAILFNSCGLIDTSNTQKAMNFKREATSVKYSSEYATTVNKLELSEGNFECYRRVTFYNVRLGENVFVCEGYCHVQIDNDGDVELVVKVGPGEYLRHYLGQKQDITYFSEQLKPDTVVNNDSYRVVWNPKLWIPGFME